MKRLLPPLLVLLASACGAPDEPRQQAVDPATRVKTAAPVQRDIDYVLTALGSIESIHHPTIAAQTSGQVVSVDIVEGAAVVAGQRLASIDNTLHTIEVAKAEAELKRQTVVLENQRKEVARLQRLQKSQSVSEDQLEDQQAQLAMLEAQRSAAEQQLRQARYMESKTRIVAPHEGLVSRRHISIGDYVVLGTPLFELVSVDRLRARLAFPERDAARIRIGKGVQLVSPTAPDVLAMGELTSINPQINVASRAIEVMVEFDNPGGWLPGASVDATLVVERKAGALTLPPASIVSRDGRTVVFVIVEGRAQSREVSLGWREVEWVEILEGLGAGDRVIVEGAGLISAGSRVSEVE